MSEVIFSIIFFFIIIGTPFCGAQECEYSSLQKSYICKNIVYQFPSVYYGNYHLQCRDCQIQTFDKDTFPHENTLKSFNVSHSGLQHIAPFAFSSLKNVEYLFVQHNGIRNISENAFNGVSQLFELHLEGNLLKTVEPGFLNGISSNFINISDNILDNLPKEAFKGSISLLSLDLSYNKINKLNKDTFLGLQELEQLDLSYNFLCHVPLGAFRMLNNLRRLDLASNKFTRFHSGVFSGLKNVNFLILSGNHLTNFDSIVLLPMMHLRKLNISGNGIYTFDANDILLNAPTLRAISFEDNIFSCTLLKNVLQFFKSKFIDVEINVFRYEYQNIAGIACMDVYSMDLNVSLKFFLKKSRDEADLLISYC